MYSKQFVNDFSWRIEPESPCWIYGEDKNVIGFSSSANTIFLSGMEFLEFCGGKLANPEKEVFLPQERTFLPNEHSILIKKEDQAVMILCSYPLDEKDIQYFSNEADILKNKDFAVAHSFGRFMVSATSTEEIQKLEDFYLDFIEGKVFPAMLREMPSAFMKQHLTNRNDSSLDNFLVFLNKDELPLEAENQLKDFYKKMKFDLAEIKQLNKHIKSMNLKFKLEYDPFESPRVHVKAKFSSILESGYTSIKDMKKFLYEKREIHLIKNRYKHDYMNYLTPNVGTKLKNLLTLMG